MGVYRIAKMSLVFYGVGLRGCDVVLFVCCRGSRFGKINSTWREFSFGLKGLTELYPVYVKVLHQKVAKHQRYIVGEEGSDPDSHAPKPAKATKKSKPSAPKAGPVTKPAAAQQPKPKPAPAKTQEKKHKMVTETSDRPSPAKISKPGLVTKRFKPTRSLSLVDEFVDEGISEKQPRFDDEEADTQRGVEESLKSVHDAHRGPLPPVVFREPDSRKFQPLPEVRAKGKEKRRTPVPNEPSGHAKSPSIYAEPSLTDSDTESDEEVSPVVGIGAQDKGQAGPNSGVQIEGHAGSNPGDDAEPQPQSSHVVHVRPNLKHMDLEAADVSTQQHLEKMDEGFGDQFFNDKPFEAENKKTTAETKAESMVSVRIHQDTSAIPRMTSPVIDLISRPDSPNDHRPLPVTITTTITTLPLPPQPQQGTTDSIFIKRIALEKSMNHVHTDELLTDLAEARRKKKKRHDSLKIPPGSPPQQPPLPPPLAGPSRTLVSPGASGSSQLPLTPLPPSTSQSDQSKSTATLSSSKTYQMKECQKILTGSMDELIISSKGGRHALSVLKMKAAYYPDVGLEQMVPDKMWIEKECKYDIAAMYGISHWWFQRKQFYIDRHTYKGDRRAVQTHMWILSVVRIKVFSMYGYDYMKKIVLRTTDLNEHIIAEKDLKYLYPSDFDDLYLLNLHGHLNHLPPIDKKILTIAVNLWTRHLVIRQRIEDFQLGIESYQTKPNLTKP
nr:hypothetical protein [Tanacetum cinerariifolium]